MEKLIQHNRPKVIDLLTARLAFERTGVKLYDAVVAKLEASSDEELARALEPLREYRAQEQEHEAWLEAQIRALGGDAQSTTELADLELREAQGIERVILNGDNEPSHVFHALLTAELSDHAGWELLVALAEEAGDRGAERAFRERLHHEEEHLGFARKVVARFARAQVLGERSAMPAEP